MIISVWPVQDASGCKASDEAEACVSHVWQAELLAMACAKRYGSLYAVCLDGDPVQVYDKRGILLRTKRQLAKG